MYNSVLEFRTHKISAKSRMYKKTLPMTLPCISLVFISIITKQVAKKITSLKLPVKQCLFSVEKLVTYAISCRVVSYECKKNLPLTGRYTTLSIVKDVNE